LPKLMAGEAPPAAGSPLPAPAPFVAPVQEPEPRRGQPDRIEQALAALAARKPARARRLGEEVARSGPLDAERRARLHKLVVALDRSGARRQSLFLVRTLAEVS